MHGSGGAGSKLWLLVLACALVLSFAMLFVLGYRHVATTLPARQTQESVPNLPAPLSTLLGRAPAPAGPPEPRYTAEDGRRSAEDAGRDFLAAVQRGDAETLVKYALGAQRAGYASEDDMVRDLSSLSFDEARVLRSKSRGDKAVLIAAASNTAITDKQGRPAPIDVVLQLQREEGHWKLFRQHWLIATPLVEYEREAMNWLASSRAAESGRDDPPQKIGSQSR